MGFERPAPARRLWAAESCTEDGCTTRPTARNLCSKHYQRRKIAGTLPEKVRRAGVRQGLEGVDCTVPTCAAPAKARGYCQRHYQRSARYGLTADELAAIDESPQCEACRGPAGHVDHDHATARVRGLLCADCNRALGMLREDPARIARLLAYLLDNGVA